MNNIQMWVCNSLVPLICFVLLSSQSHCQTEGANLLNYQMLSLHDWRADSSWFGSKRVKLTALSKSCKPVERDWGGRENMF